MTIRILVPLDGSALAEEVIPQIGRLVRLSGAELVLVRTAGITPATEGYSGLIPRLDQEVRAYLEAEARRLEKKGIKIRILDGEGEAAPFILEAAEKQVVSFIAMSTHGRTGLMRFIMGSITEKVIRATRVPVLVIRSNPDDGRPPADAPGEIGFRNILAPLDGSPMSIQGLNHIAPFFRHLDAKVTLLYVTEELPEGRRWAPAEESLDEAIRSLSEVPIPHDRVSRSGDPATEILGAADDLKADLIVMTTHGRSGVSRWVFGSVTEKVIKAARVPMLVVPAPGRWPR